MCGITGVVRLDGPSVDRKTTARITGAIAHRGPSGDGTWVDGAVGFGHRRLAVIDLTPATAQPMCNETGRRRDGLQRRAIQLSAAPRRVRNGRPAPTLKTPKSASGLSIATTFARATSATLT